MGYRKNLPLTPETVSYGSGTGCPYCSGRRAISGETDLATRYPDLAAEWHPTRNGDLSPADVLPGSHRLVWWQCEHGHEWRAQIKSRVAGTGCPVCSNRALLRGENDLATNYPELARQWHPTKNGQLTPSDVVPGTRRKVWWVCDKGHEWRASVSARVNGSGCPVCASNKKSLVALSQRPRLSGCCRQPHPAQRWVPILCQYEGVARLQRSRYKISRDRSPVASNHEWIVDTGPCSSGKPEKSMVAMQFRARMASCDLFADRQSEQWLPVLHRLCFRKTVESIPEISARDVCA